VDWFEVKEPGTENTETVYQGSAFEDPDPAPAGAWLAAIDGDRQ
jgi:hypothetical protein